MLAIRFLVLAKLLYASLNDWRFCFIFEMTTAKANTIACNSTMVAPVAESK